MKKNLLRSDTKIESYVAKDNSLDKTDRKILNMLQEDNQITNIELAEKVGISPPSCFRRVKRLRESGIIAKDVSLIDPFKIGQSLVVFVSVTLEKQREDMLSHFERNILNATEVAQCYFISGEIDYLLVVHVRDMNHYHEFSRRVFVKEANIRMFRSSFCLKRVKYDTKVQIYE